MCRTFLGELQIFLLLVIGSIGKQNFSDALSLNDGSVIEVRLTDNLQTPHTRQVNLKKNSTATFNVTNVSSSTSFIIFQFHSYQYNVTLSLDKDHLNKVSNRSVYGTNIGLYHKQTTNITTQCFVKNDNTVPVQGIFVAIIYTDKAPIPGGCNMEFNTEIAPYARVQRRQGLIIVDVQPAAVPARNGSRPICEKNPVDVEMYHMFLAEQDFSATSYFNAITNMLTVENIKANGVQVSSPLSVSPLRRVFSAYTGVGSVYVAVAVHGNQSAAYVPAFSYACDPIIEPDSCKLLPYISWKIVCALCLIVGIPLIYLGSMFPPVDMAWPVFFVGSVIGYIFDEDNIEIIILIGVVILVLWLAVQYILPLVGLGIFHLTLGLFFTCVAYFQSSDSFTALQNDWIFWMLFIAMAIGITLALMPLCCFSHIIACAIFSSFAIILPLDYYFGSSLKYIVINIARRIKVEGFNYAIVRPPTQFTDISLIVGWVLLGLFRLYRQVTGGSSGYMPL